jgi:hypothetical protein
LPVPQLRPGWPCHQTALVRGPFCGHPGGRCGSQRADSRGAERSRFHWAKSSYSVRNERQQYGPD